MLCDPYPHYKKRFVLKKPTHPWVGTLRTWEPRYYSMLGGLPTKRQISLMPNSVPGYFYTAVLRR